MPVQSFLKRCHALLSKPKASFLNILPRINKHVQAFCYIYRRCIFLHSPACPTLEPVYTLVTIYSPV